MYLFIPFIILIVLTGIISTFTIYNHNSQISGIIEAVEIGKNIQIELQKQFYNLRAIVEEDEFSDIYKQKVHDYSYNVQIIQNELFNLGLLCKENKEIYDQIQEFAKYYKELNDGILSYIVNINAQKQFNDTNIISIQLGEEQKAIQLIEDIVKKIDERSDEKLRYLNRYSFVMSTVSFIVLTIFSLIVSLYLSQLLNKFKDKLEQRVIKRTEQLQKAKDQIMLSEQRYKFLVESTNDIVFTMDMDGIVLTINNAVKKELKIKPSEAIGKNFYDFLYFENDTNNLKNIFLRKNIKNFLNEKKQIKFYSLIKTPRLIEPIEMFVSLEAVEINGNKEIVGKASNMLENDLIGSFIHEHVKYEINNSLLLADEIAHRVVVNLKKFLPNNIISQLRLATSELLINAIEHGNLGITYEDKLTCSGPDSSSTFFA
jgi:PAS domain-containing protein